MFFVEQYGWAVFFCVITMLCWGSWGNTQKLAGKSWRYELYYWDYVIGVLVFSLLVGLTFGSFGSQGRAFLPDLIQADWSNLQSALIGGVIFNAANLLLAASISIAGMSVAFPVGIGLALILGVIVNYIGEPQGDPLLLFTGVVLIAVAILLNAGAYRIKEQSRKRVPTKGIVLAVICGILMAFFYRFIAASMSMDFTDPAAGKLTPYSAFFVFALGMYFSNFIFNTIAMRFPVSGSPVQYKDYFAGTKKLHSVGILGGVIWGTGNILSLVAAGSAGPAISYGLGQGATLVAALWGIIVWREFRGAPKMAHLMNLAMFVIFIGGLILLVRAGM
ncbi:MAG: multidrug DMT transporter permease [Lentisphaerae bacterium]|nr:multidrug DMT transporter permease [Lentisphaerota bacterium]